MENKNPQGKAVKTNRNYANGEIKTPLNEERDETKERNKKKKHHLLQPPIQSPPISKECFFWTPTRVSQQTAMYIYIYTGVITLYHPR